MSITLATGTQIAIASTYGALVAMSALSNATEAVATLAGGHGVLVGDFLEVTSGWDLLNNRIVRVSVVATNDITFEDINTSDTDRYPAGTGTGSIRRITAWTNITQVQSVETAGGDANFVDITTIADRTQKQIPTTRSPQTISITVMDDPSQTYFPVVDAAADAIENTGLRIIFPNGSRTVANGYWSLGDPAVNINAPLTRQISFSGSAAPTRYAT
jgi:hypothetical protein